MDVLYFCPRWGSEQLPYIDFFRKAKDAGFDGIEMDFPYEAKEREHILNTLEKMGLLYIAQHWETIDIDIKKHKENYRKRLLNLAGTQPLFINSQTGRDFFSFEQNKEIVAIADEVMAETGIKIVHETHRGKFSFACHITREFLSAMPHLRLTLDASHWCNVAESMFADQQESLNLAISRTDHIHARVGFPESPQVPDPRAPEWEQTLETFVYWWQKVIDTAVGEGKNKFTILSEFGPFPYMPIQPFTQVPITNQWDVNVFMKDFLQNHLNH